VPSLLKATLCVSPAAIWLVTARATEESTIPRSRVQAAINQQTATFSFMIRSFLFIANRPGDYDRIAVVSRTEMEGKIGYCGQKKRFENNKTEKQNFSYVVLIYFLINTKKMA
jgi:hypothetical protein